MAAVLALLSIAGCAQYTGYYGKGKPRHRRLSPKARQGMQSSGPPVLVPLSRGSGLCPQGWCCWRLSLSG